MFLEAVDSFRLTCAVQACTAKRLDACLAAAPTACVAAHLSEAAAVAAAFGCVLGYVGGGLAAAGHATDAWVVDTVVAQEAYCGSRAPSLLTAMRGAPGDGRVALLAAVAALHLVRASGGGAGVRCVAHAAGVKWVSWQCVDCTCTGVWWVCCMH